MSMCRVVARCCDLSRWSGSKGGGPIGYFCMCDQMSVYAVGAQPVCSSKLLVTQEALKAGLVVDDLESACAEVREAGKGVLWREGRW